MVVIHPVRDSTLSVQGCHLPLDPVEEVVLDSQAVHEVVVSAVVVHRIPLAEEVGLGVDHSSKPDLFSAPFYSNPN